MQFRMIKSAIVVVGAALACAGCPPTVNSVDIRPNGYDWIKTDSGLTDVASVEAVRQRREGDHLRVEVDIRNLKSTQEGFQYQFIWTDDGGFAIATPFPWTTDFIQGRQAKTIVGIAPDPRATKVRLELRRFIQ